MNLLPGPQNGPDSQDDDQAGGHASQHAAGHRGSSRGQRERARPKPTILSEDQCLEALSSLPRLLTLEFISPQKANSIRAILQTILGAHQNRQAGRHSSTPDRASLRSMLRVHPEIANALVGLLSEAEIESLLDSLRDDEPGAADHGR